MTYRYNDPATLSLANGTDATAANSAAPNGFTPTKSNGGTVKKQAGGWQCVGPATGAARMDLTVPSTPRYSVRVTFTEATTTADCRIVDILDHARVEQLADGRLRLFDVTGSRWTSPVAAVAPFSVALSVEIGTTTTDGDLHMAVYPSRTSATPIAGWVFDSTTSNVGTVNVTGARAAKITSAPAATYTVSDWQDNDATAALLPGLATANVVATIAADKTTYEPGEPIRLTLGGGATEALTQTAGPTGVGLTRAGAAATVEAPHVIGGGALTFAHAVTGDPTPATVTVSVLRPTRRRKTATGFAPVAGRRITEAPVLGASAVLADTDTTPYYVAVPGGPVQDDTDGVPYLTGTTGAGVAFDTDGTPYLTNV